MNAPRGRLNEAKSKLQFCVNEPTTWRGVVFARLVSSARGIPCAWSLLDWELSFIWSALEVVSSGCGPLLNSVSSGCGAL